MFTRLTDKDIDTALSELITLLGVKDDVSSATLVRLLRKQGAAACVQQIAAELGLPCKINLSYVSATFASDKTLGFESDALVETDWRTGRGTESIAAQVMIPSDLPMFGTSDLANRTIEVRVTKNSIDYAYTFIATLAHELSHVLLAALWSSYKDSELHTDLVPILLGFREFVRKGRSTSDSTGEQVTKHGYLEDSQFKLAWGRVGELLSDYRQRKRRLMRMATEVERKLKMTSGRAGVFRRYFDYLDNHPPKRMTAQDARRMVELHGRESTQEWEECIAEARRVLGAVAKLVPQLSHYTSNTLQRLKVYSRELESVDHVLGRVMEAIRRDTRMLGRYVGLLPRLRGRLGARM